MTSLSFDHNPRRKRIVTYVILGAVALTLMIIALFVFSSAKTNLTAEQRAEELQTEFQKAGLPVPSVTQITRVLGADGGAMCNDPVNALHKANLNAQMANGAAGPGTRPTTVDPDVIKGQELAIGVYCPEQLPAFTEYVNQLKFANVVKD
jgi:hypothetical protein